MIKPLISRRDFLTAATAASAVNLVCPSWMRAVAESVDPTLVEALSRTIGVDMHNHVYPAGTEPNPHRGPSEPQEASPFALPLAGELKKSGLTAVCASFVLDFTPSKQPGDFRTNFLAWLTAIDTELAKGHVRRALTLADITAAHQTSRPVIVQSVEGAMFLEGHLDRVEEVYKRGLRHLQLLHEHDDLVAPLGDTNTGTSHLGGLTPFGASVIKECNRLGIVVDLAHASHETVLAAVKTATQPLIISHTSLLERPASNSGNPRMIEMMKPRLISREHARIVAGAGGVIGVWTKLTNTLPDFVESLQAMVDAVGIDHVGIGTDTDLLSPRPGQGTNFAYSNLTAGFFPSIVAEMLHQGFTPSEISKVGGGNFCRVFGKVTEGHA